MAGPKQACILYSIALQGVPRVSDALPAGFLGYQWVITGTNALPRRPMEVSRVQVTVLSEGYQLYFGRPEDALYWFGTGLGFTYNLERDGAVSDWLMDLVSVGFQKPESFTCRSMCTVEDVVMAYHAFQVLSCPPCSSSCNLRLCEFLLRDDQDVILFFFVFFLLFSSSFNFLPLLIPSSSSSPSPDCLCLLLSILLLLYLNFRLYSSSSFYLRKLNAQGRTRGGTSSDVATHAPSLCSTQHEWVYAKGLRIGLTTTKYGNTWAGSRPGGIRYLKDKCPITSLSTIRSLVCRILLGCLTKRARWVSQGWVRP